MFKSSYSQISRYQRCADQWLREPKQPPTPAMDFGNDVHAVRSVLIDERDPASVTLKSGRQLEVMHLAAMQPIPKRDDVLSNEGSGIPKRYQIQLYGKTMGQIEIAPGYMLTWVEDCVIPESDETLAVKDWKTGRPDEDAHALQGACYVLPAFSAYPGFSRYVFRPVYLQFPEADYSLEYTPADAEIIRTHLLGLMKRMEAVKIAGEATPTINKYCGSCGLRSSCSAFTKAVTVAPEPAAYPMETPAQVVRAREELASIRKCVESMEEIADEKLKALCAAGPVIVNSQEWYLKETPSRYEYDSEGVEAALVTNKIDPLPFFKPDRTELKKLEKSAPAAFAAVQAHERVKSSSMKLYNRIARGVIDITPPLPPVDSPESTSGSATGGGDSLARLPPALQAAVEAAGDLPPVESSELPIFSRADGVCPRCGAPLRIVPALAPLRDHFGLSCPSHGVVAWLSMTTPAGPVQPPAGELPMAEPQKPKRTRRPSPVHSCGKRCRWESHGSPTAYCIPCAEVFRPVPQQSSTGATSAPEGATQK